MFFRNESFKDFIRFYPTVSVIVGINVILWLLMFLSTSLGVFVYEWGVGWNIAVSRGQYWRLVTPIFLHDPDGISHILFNSFSLILFGPALEQMLGKIKFIIVFLFTGIIGNVFTYLIDMESLVPHLGASGALYGLLGLLLYMSYFKSHLIDPGSKQIVVVISIVGILMSFIQPGINKAAHLFGMIAGVAIGPVITNNVTPFSPWRNQPRVRRVVRNDDLGYDPNRWDKKRFRVNRNISSIIWWIIFILAILGILSGF